jgi:undecaprenyl-diphosphatase
MSAPRKRSRALGQALALGVMHGPAELLPISSSGHIALVPYLLGWKQEGDDELEKAFEVALHAGTAAALVIALRGEIAESARNASPRLAAVVMLATVPPALVGFGFEHAIEKHLGTPGTIAVGMIAGGTAMAWADRSAQERTHDEAAPVDGFWLGVGQACALFPGVSRNGSTLTAARLLRFKRADAERLSRHVALPVIAGATLLKCVRLAQRGLPEGSAAPFAVGVGASFVSTLASTRLIAFMESGRPLAPISAYRVALGATVLRRLRRDRRGAHDPVRQNTADAS